jgi:hypothetical protein
MLRRIFLIALFAALLSLFQTGAQAQAPSSGQAGGMLKPPPVSGESYRVETNLEDRSNYISGGILGGVGYIDNLYPGSSMGNLAETAINLQPAIEFETKSARERMSARYSPTFIFYFPTSALNEADENATFSLQYRFNRRLSMDLGDRLMRSSTGFGQIGSGGISGSAQITTPQVITPFGTRFSNDASGGLSYQFSPHGMIGGSGNLGFLNYPKTQVLGLYNSDSRGVSGFYSARISASQYLGANYQYEQVFAYPTGPQYETQTHTIYGFYTLYLSENFSLSVSGGPQRFIGEHAPDPTTSAWTPAVTASLGWQNRHTSLAANFSRIVSGGGGLLGAFYSRNAGATGMWQMSRLWNANLNARYSINKNATPSFGLNNLVGGHSLDASVALNRILTTRSSVGLSYDRIQNRYDGIPSIDKNPSSDRIMLSYTWQFERPIGR